MSTPRLVPCPTCGQPCEFSSGNRWRPFCSERCKLIDLGQWASENYRIPDHSPAQPDENDAAPLQ